MKNSFFRVLSWAVSLLISLSGLAQPKVGHHQAPGAGNPLVPGYFADPTIKKFGDTYYLYATTDGNGGGYGPAQVWTSKDFVNWTNQRMNWPTTPHCWAPDVTRGNDGRYYMYYCQPTVEIYGASSASPTGPWTPLFADGRAVVKNHLVPDVITLDGQTFRDDDGQFYMFWGTWGIYPNSGCGIGRLNADMKTFSQTAKLPNTIAKDFFEAPFMVKRNGIYYLTYSSGRCEDGTYRVQYVMSKTGPMGPFMYGKNNPILVTSADGTVHGPGHQSVIEHGGTHYLVYHRHNNPHSGGGYHRQVCADKLTFDAEGNIEKVVPTHTGIGPLGTLSETAPDRALGKRATASSAYDADFKPEFAVDNNNGTLWKPKDNTSDAWLQIDLGSVQPVRRIQTQFEYATWYYQYLLEYSTDGRNWITYADRRWNTQAGSPLIDRGNARARYVRLTITDTEYPGLNRAVWNLRVYGTDGPAATAAPSPSAPVTHQAARPNGLLLDLSADSLAMGQSLKQWPNRGKLGGTIDVGSARQPFVDLVAGRKAVVFSGREFLRSSVAALSSLAGNSSYSVSMWVFNPAIADEEPILSWTPRGGRELSNSSVGYGKNRNWGAVAHWGWPDMPYATLPKAGTWHHIGLTFDGTMERLYVDGKLDREERKTFFMRTDGPLYIGTNGDRTAFFSGAIASLKLYDIALSQTDLRKQAMQPNNTPIQVSLNAAKLPYGHPLSIIPNDGSVGGAFQVTRQPVSVQTVDGKLAVIVPEGNQLRIYIPEMPISGKGSSTVTVHYEPEEKMWKHSVSIHRGDQSILYQNGRPTTKYPTMTVVVGEQVTTVPDTAINQDKKEVTHQLEIETQLVETSAPPRIDIVSPSVATADLTLNWRVIAQYQVYDRALLEVEAKALYADWKATMQPLAQPTFARKPAAVTPTSVDMMAAVPDGQSLQYRFDDTTNHSSSGWLDEPTFTAYGLQPDQTYQYTLTVRDAFGNVSPASEPLSVRTATDQFTVVRPSFDTALDLLKAGFDGTGWDGLIGLKTGETATAITTNAGSLRLESAGSNWDGNAPNGPFLYKIAPGDFVAQVAVSDVSGQRERKANGANDVGLMVRLADDVPGESLIQNSVFPGWNVGNMVTNLSARGREQTNNQAGWDFDRYLQIQRQGDTFHLRGSQDGQHWHDLPGSPLTRPDWHGKALQVGLFQATYGPQSGYGEFQQFDLVMPR